MILVYIDLGRASLVAKQHVTIAEIWEAEPDQIEKSIEHYRKASQVYRGEEQQSQVSFIPDRKFLKSSRPTSAI